MAVRENTYLCAPVTNMCPDPPPALPCKAQDITYSK